MSRLSVLFIDDDETTVRVPMKWVGEAHDCYCIPFKNFEAEISNRQPDIVIVDRFEGSPPEGVNEGAKVIKLIWDQRFCPIVIYSAFPDANADDPGKHPLVLLVKKGGDLEEFKTAVNGLVMHAEAIHDAEQYVRQQFSLAMRDVAPYAAETYKDPVQCKDAVVRHGRRRLAALMDEMSLGNLSSWEQYIYPPVSKDLLLGDIVRLKSGDPSDPQSFCVVLTPSCDLATAEGRPAKVSQVLVAGCYKPKEGIRKTPLCKLDKKELSASLASTLLTQGYYQRVVPFPGLKGIIPPMMADLKDLKHVLLSDIGSAGGAHYVKVASLDSPFRELISWAYMHTACRPGLPDRDYDSWAKEIVDACHE